MKERIIIEIPKDMCDNCNSCDKPISAQIECYLKEERQVYETVKVPENWEELKELVKNNIFEDNRNGVKIGERIKIEYILIAGKSFMPNGYILDEDNNVFAKNLTPAQMWAIIKSLIGEK